MQILNYTPRINLKKKITKPKFFLEKQNRFGSVFWDKNRFKPVWLDFFRFGFGSVFSVSGL
jgi:hypothetical protein